MHVWRLVATRHAATALSGDGAARYGGRWNSPGTRMVYAADSLALATLELSVHLVGAKATYRAMQLDVPDDEVIDLPSLPRRWRTDLAASRRAGDTWAGVGDRLAAAVPSALVDPRSGERNVLLNPAHPALRHVEVVQQFDVVLDERL